MNISKIIFGHLLYCSCLQCKDEHYKGNSYRRWTLLYCSCKDEQYKCDLFKDEQYKDYPFKYEHFKVIHVKMNIIKVTDYLLIHTRHLNDISTHFHDISIIILTASL